jgi:hypothetical protein
MQDIRKPYSRSKSDRGREIRARVEEFEEHNYHDDQIVDEDPVEIPVKKTFRERRNIDQMEMYPSRGRRASDYEDGARTGRRSDDPVVYRDPRTRYERKNQSVGTLAFILTLLIIIIGGSLLTFVFNKATITLVPKHADLSDFRKTVTFAQAGVDTEDTVLYMVATTSISKTKELALSEKKSVQSKASGKIVIYNNYSSDPQRLIKNTRFESASGKIYRIANSVTVPGKSGSTPGSIQVTVYADSYGTDYNSAPTDFTIPGFKGAAQYTTFYARSNGAITGGASGNVSSASLADINAAKDELAIELAQAVKDELGKVKQSGYVGLYSAPDIVYEDNENDLLAGTTATYKVTATGYLMLAKGDEFAQKVAEDARDYKGEPVRLDDTDKLTYTRKDADRLYEVQSLDLLVEGSPRVVFLTDEQALKAQVAGKPRSDFAAIMKGISSVEGAEIGFFPMWLSTFPKETSKIVVVESLPKR